ncbi:HD domain-containing protein [Ammoniphilus resinae]|uniref:HD domain-containing protein n=1 Tax=Ammoniphilus resinae TaxID=861532 RepID=A0ABS4GJ27_9BACL|nr:HD domain-containing protein [Ammoniphilus resinae]MBP1930229.1 uncharacterized protein [Ammoniphilus resinae]
MDKRAIIEAAENFAKEELATDSSGHDWWHIYRVTKSAEKIAQMEGANEFICALAALLHDLADEKLIGTGNEAAGIAKIKQWLLHHGVTVDDMEHVIEIIGAMSFKGGNRSAMRTLEGKVVQDADRLDALGAVGIARTFAYSGAKGQLSHDPTLAPRENMTAEEYRMGKSTAINHFYEKLLKLKDLMNTDYAKELAAERHQFMVGFLTQFYAEWEGEK